MQWVWPYQRWWQPYLEQQVSSELETSDVVGEGVLTLLLDPGDVVSESSHGCEVMGAPSPDTPRSGLTACAASATPTSLSNHTFLHGDLLVITGWPPSHN